MQEGGSGECQEVFVSDARRFEVKSAERGKIFCVFQGCKASSSKVCEGEVEGVEALHGVALCEVFDSFSGDGVGLEVQYAEPGEALHVSQKLNAVVSELVVGETQVFDVLHPRGFGEMFQAVVRDEIVGQVKLLQRGKGAMFCESVEGLGAELISIKIEHAEVFPVVRS